MYFLCILGDTFVSINILNATEILKIHQTVFTKLSEDSLDIRSSGKASCTGPKSTLPVRIIKIDIIYKNVFLITFDGNLVNSRI